MDFELVAKAAVRRTVREGTYSDELMNDVAEIWEISQSHGTTHLIETGSFPDEEEAKKWLSKAQTYGKTQGIFIHQARGVLPKKPNALVVWAESTEERVSRIESRKAAEEEKAARKAAGVEVKPGRRKKSTEVKAS